MVDILMYSDGDEPHVLAGVMIKSIRVEKSPTILLSSRIGNAMEESVLEYRAIIQDDLADEDEIIEAGQFAHELVWAPIQGKALVSLNMST